MPPRAGALGWTLCSCSPSPCTDRRVPLLPNEQNKASIMPGVRRRGGLWEARHLQALQQSTLLSAYWRLDGGHRTGQGHAVSHGRRPSFVKMFFLLISPTISPRKHNGNSLIQKIARGIPQTQRVLAGDSSPSPAFPAVRPGSK